MSIARPDIPSRAGSRPLFLPLLCLGSRVFFAFNKQAFLNDYAFVVGALFCALAAATPMPTDEAP